MLSNYEATQSLKQKISKFEQSVIQVQYFSYLSKENIVIHKKVKKFDFIKKNYNN